MSIKKIIAVVYTVLAILAVAAGFLAPNQGPLNFIFVYLLGLPWVLVGNLFSEIGVVGGYALGIGSLILNAAILWWWALRKSSK